MNTIHPTAIIDETAELGDNNVIGAYCVIGINVVIGNNNTFVSHCCIGFPPEHKGIDINSKESKFKTIIGNNNIFREFITINQGYVRDTVIGSNNYLMANTHVGHDCVLEDNITISCSTLLAGHVTIDHYANLGLGSVIHQFSHIGSGAMLGMGTIVPKNKAIMPFNIYVGNPCRLLKENTYLINKLGINSGELEILRMLHQKD